ncbi:LptF/LptG family permease [Deltaproteobacteria bacterium TL4]
MITFRSLFLQLIAPFTMGTVILTFVLSLDTVYRLIDLIVTKGVNVVSVILMLLYRLPQFLSITIPLSMLIATFMMMIRLSMELELTAMRACGMSYWYIGRPIFAFGIFTTALTYLLTLWLQPYGFSAFETEKLKVLKSHTAKNIQPKVLNYDFQGQVMYVQDKGKNGELVGVFITDLELKPGSMVVMANGGNIQVREDQQDVVLRLNEGKIHKEETEPDVYRTIAFKTLNYISKLPDIVPSTTEKGGHIWGVTTRELLKREAHIAKIELLLRLTTPWACLGFAFGALSLGITNPRRGRSGAYLRALILLVVYYILWLGAKELTRFSGASPQILWIPPLVILVYGLYSIYKMDNHLDHIIDVFKYLFMRRV